MILYHGSPVIVEKPDISLSRDALDFGRGFYTTPLKHQAEWWAAKLKLKQNTNGFVSSYELDEPAMRETATVLEFSEHNEAWLDFIIANRFRQYHSTQYDVVIGGVANDKVFNVLQMYVDGNYDKQEAIRRLRYHKPNVQYCFCSQSVIDRFIRFVSAEKL